MLRRRLAGLGAALLLVVTGITMPAAAAGAAPGAGCERIDPSTGECVIRTPPVVTDPTDPPPSGGRPGEPVCIFWDEVVPCSTSFGPWVDSLNSWCQVLDPQPPMDSQVWEGNTEGAIYSCVHGLAGSGIPGTHGGWVWLPEPPEAGPSARELADQAVATMGLRAGEIGMAPPPGPASTGLVGLQTWLWVADPGESTVGPITRTASAAGLSVTATATLDRIVWNMGDGGSVTCSGAGTPYADVHGASPSPDCGYTYTRSSAGRPGQAYTVTATSFWTVTWSGGGLGGTIPLDFSRSVELRVAEVQSLVTR